MYVCISMYNLIPRIDTHIVSKLKRIEDLIQDYIFESSAFVNTSFPLHVIQKYNVSTAVLIPKG